jgi:carboxypeptidase Taq
MSQSTHYQTIVDYANRLHNIEQADHILRWDSDVMMPEGGADARSAQRSTLSKTMYDLRSSAALGRALESVDESELSDDQQAVVREIRRQHEIVSSVPSELNEQIADVNAEAHEAWKAAKEADDWSKFAPAFEKHIELRREWADHVDPDSDPYEVLWKNKLGYTSQPFIDLSTVDRVFDRLRETLPTLIEDVRESDAELATDAFTDRGPYDPADQKAAFEDVLDELGIDWSRARFDTAPHPFSYGNAYDVRLTTRFDEEDPIGGFSATMHEFGHTTYHHGLPQEQYGTPLARARGLTIHGSQSGLWENHIGRSEAFWELVLPIFREYFPQLDDVSAGDAYEAVNQVNEDNVVRTAADELTYNIHVLVRTEIEKALVSSEMDVEAVPQVWADKYEEYLGVRPETDSEGPLQDPHWAGSIPGFINYTLGHHVLAAQVRNAAEQELEFDSLVRNGEVGPIRDWMTENIHRHGQRYKSQELVSRATGEEITADYFLEYIEDKFRTLYDC